MNVFNFIVEDRKMKGVLVIVALMGMLSPFALGDVVVDDHFDDGAIGTNTTGIGSGFNSATYSAGWTDPPVSAYVTESGTTVSLINEQLGWSRSAITSKEGAGIGANTSRFEFRGVSFSRNASAWDWGGGGGGTDRLALGVRGDSIAEDTDAGLATGFWIQMESDSLYTGVNSGWNGISTLFYNSSADVKTQLATWSFDTLDWEDWANQGAWDFSPVLDITLDIDATSYALSIAGDTITLLSGAMSGAFVNDLTTGYAFAFEQTEYPSLDTSIDQVVITEIPEPATLALLGLGGLLLRRKK